MWEISKNRLAFCKILKILVSSHVVYHETEHMNDIQNIQNKIYEVRGRKVMLDTDLAELYQVETKNLKRAVRANIERFPDDFMFELTKEEYDSLRCNFFTLKAGRGQHSKYLPFAFLHDQNDINESTQSQLDAISIALAELQSKESRQSPRRRIGFIQSDETTPQETKADY